VRKLVGSVQKTVEGIIRRNASKHGRGRAVAYYRGKEVLGIPQRG